MKGIHGIFRGPRTRVGAARSGLTLLEVVIVVGLVALVAGLLVVALRGVRTQRDDARSLTNVRTGVQMFTMWGDDRKGEHLNYERDPRRYDFRVGAGPRGEQVILQWHAQALQQNWAYAWAWTTQEPPRFGGFRYCWPFLTDPRAWTSPYHDFYVSHPRSFREEFRPTFRQEVLFPSAKSMLTAKAAASPADLTDAAFITGFADGSAALLTKDAAQPQLRDPYSLGATNIRLTGNGTVGGLHGRDR